ncbi:unnamed protein product [Cutaneotrichosporon oleaginosum]
MRPDKAAAAPVSGDESNQTGLVDTSATAQAHVTDWARLRLRRPSVAAPDERVGDGVVRRRLLSLPAVLPRNHVSTWRRRAVIVESNLSSPPMTAGAAGEHPTGIPQPLRQGF